MTERSSAKTTLPLLTSAAIATAAIATFAAVLAGSGFGLEAGPLAAQLDGSSSTVLLAIALLGCIVVGFTARYCIDDPGPRRLGWGMVGTILAAGTVAVAANLVTLLAGWLLTTLLLGLLLAHRSDLAIVRNGRARTWVSLLTGDAMLVAAAAIVAAEAGNAHFSDLGSVSAELSSSSVLGVDAGLLTALLVTGAALGRCAQLPIGAWLTTTLAAPTPVSALMHAGVVNGGALLLLALAPIVFAQDAVVWLLFTVAAVTMLWGTTQMVVRPDVKGGLMLSTRGQMAFMLLQCAVGAFAAALFHLIAHGMYKAYLFLASGNAIAEHRVLAAAPALPVPPAQGRRALRQAAVAIVAPALVLAGAVTALAPGLAETSSGLVLLLFAFATGAQATWWWQRFREPRGLTALAGLGVLAVAAGAYVELLDRMKALFEIGPVSSAVPAEALIPVFLIAVSASGLQWLTAAGVELGETHPRLRRLQRRTYALALAAGTWMPSAAERAQTAATRFAPDPTPQEAR